MRAHPLLIASACGALALFGTAASAEPLALTEPMTFPRSVFQQIAPEPEPYRPPRVDAVPDDAVASLPERFRRQVVPYDTGEAPGTIVVDTPHTYLYYVLPGGRAIRYGIGVGREGFTWSGVQTVARKQEWPDWYPPAEMIARQPYLPRMMSGGPGNPLGARAIYLGHTEYRIHGTNAPETIGKHVSSGCIRMLNEDAIDLYNRTPLGTKVVVLPDRRDGATAAQASRRARTAPVRTRAARVTPPERVSENTPVIQTAPAHAPASRTTESSDRVRALLFGTSASRIY